MVYLLEGNFLCTQNPRDDCYINGFRLIRFDVSLIH